MKRRLRIAILAHSTNPRGGVVHALELGDALCRLGHDATVHAPDAGGRGFFRNSLTRTVYVAASPVESLPAESEDDDEAATESGFVLESHNAAETWRRAVEKVPGLVADQAKKFSRLEVSGINRLTIHFAPENSMYKSACQRPDQVAKFERALQDVTGQTIRIDFKLQEGATSAVAGQPAARSVVSPHQRLMEAAGHPLVKRAGELFGAQPTAVDEG